MTTKLCALTMWVAVAATGCVAMDDAEVPDPEDEDEPQLGDGPGLFIPGPTQLLNGAPYRLSGSAGSLRAFYVEVDPDTTVTVHLDYGNGDADLYVNLNPINFLDVATASNYDAASTMFPPSDEHLVVPGVGSGDPWVMISVVGFSAFGRTVLTATW